MARRKGSRISVRRGPSPQVAKLKSRLASRNARSRQQSREFASDVSAVGGGILLGWLDKQAWSNPFDIPGVDDSAVYGLLLYVAGNSFMSGKAGGVAKGLGVGMLACAARDFMNGPEAD